MVLNIKSSCYSHLSTNTMTLHISISCYLLPLSVPDEGHCRHASSTLKFDIYIFFKFIIATFHPTQWHWTSTNRAIVTFDLHNDIEHQQIVLSSPLAYKMAIHIKRSYYRHLAIYIRSLYISRLFNATFLQTQWHRTSKDRVIVTLWSTQWHWTSAVRVVVTFWPTQWHWTSADHAIVTFLPKQ